MLSFLFVAKTLWPTVITNELHSFTMQKSQVIVSYVWEPTEKISHLLDCTFKKKLATRLVGSAKN